MPDEPILVINSGSSSLKFGLYVERSGEDQAVLDGLADGIGRDTGKLELKDAQGKTLRSESMRFASEDDALAHAAMSVPDAELRAQLHAMARSATIESMHERRRDWISETMLAGAARAH